MKLKVSMLTLLLYFCTTIEANDARNLWKLIPDSLVQSVDKVRRLEMLDLVDYKVKAEVDNRFGSQSVMDTITTDYLHVSVSKSSEMAMRLLPVANGDTIVCLVQTYKAPMAESDIKFYDTKWHQLDVSHYLPFRSISQATDSLFCKPDTMTEQRFDELRQNIVAALVSAETNVDDSDLILSLSLPMVSIDDKDAMASITRKIRLRWNDERYIAEAE